MLESLEALLTQIQRLRVGVIGDFALDFYYTLQKNTPEYSLETGKQVHWGSRPVASLGGAGNVAQNVAAMGVQSLSVFGCVGYDLYGREMLHLFEAKGIDTASLLQLTKHWDTCTYTKPMLGGEDEANRIDFGTHNVLGEEAFEQILYALRSALPDLDVLIINQQFPNPLLSPKRIQLLNALIKDFPHCYVVADLRHFGDVLRGATLKVNTQELAQLVHIPTFDAADAAQCTRWGQQLSERIEGPVLITRGEHGMMWVSADQEPVQHPALRLSGPLDTVGAGDTSVAAYALGRAAGAEEHQALLLANLAAAVTVQKLHQTGTATAAEIHELLRQYSEA